MGTPPPGGGWSGQRNASHVTTSCTRTTIGPIHVVVNRKCRHADGSVSGVIIFYCGIQNVPRGLVRGRCTVAVPVTRHFSHTEPHAAVRSNRGNRRVSTVCQIHHGPDPQHGIRSDCWDRVWKILRGHHLVTAQAARASCRCLHRPISRASIFIHDHEVAACLCANNDSQETTVPSPNTNFVWSLHVSIILIIVSAHVDQILPHDRIRGEAPNWTSANPTTCK